MTSEAMTKSLQEKIGINVNQQNQLLLVTRQWAKTSSAHTCWTFESCQRHDFVKLTLNRTTEETMPKCLNFYGFEFSGASLKICHNSLGTTYQVD